MSNVIQFPIERRIEQMLAELPDLDFEESSSINMHLDILNDLAADEMCELNARRAIEDYCDFHGLQSKQFTLHWQHDSCIVTLTKQLT